MHHEHDSHQEHTHTYAHTHTHEHHHGHDHEHPHDHSYTHSHDHGDQPHSHDHHPHTHDDHDHCHGQGHHHHDHEHCSPEACASCAGGCQHTPMEELVALMKYMANHNAAHAQELAALAKQLDEAGQHMAYEQVMLAVSDYEKGNMRLATVLAALG